MSKKINALEAAAKGKWSMHTNSSWGEDHNLVFGDKFGYLICHSHNNQLVAIGSICGAPFAPGHQTLANATLMLHAKQMAMLVKALTCLNETHEHYRSIAGIIQEARNIMQALEIDIDTKKQIETDPTLWDDV